MKLDKRKKPNTKHFEWGQKPKLAFEERMQQVEAVDPYSKEGKKLQKESAKKNGRAWWIFHGVNFRNTRKITWLEKFRKKARQSTI